MLQKFVYRITVLFACIILIALNGPAQKKFTVTSSRANNYCNGACTLFDNADLTGNPTAVIFVTPVNVNGVNLNPHPICAYYNGKQWSVMNIDNSTMPEGAQFNVQYYAAQDDKNFVHVVSKENLVKSNSYIDHAGLNGSPGARFQFFQNASPNIRGGLINKEEVKFQYDEMAGKWFVSNVSGKPLDMATGYNIAVISEINPAPVSAISTPITSNTTNSPAHPTNPPTGFILMTVVGQQQGQFNGELNTNMITILSFEMDISSPHDLITGQSNGKRQYAPIVIQKSCDSSSIQFFKSIVTNENLSSVTFSVYKVNRTGINILDYKIVLTNAAINDFRHSYTDDNLKRGYLMDWIKFTFQSIEIIDGTLIASDARSLAN